MTAVPSKEVTSRQITAVNFGFFTDEEIRKLSVKQLMQPVLFDSLKNPVPGGLYDPAMGPTDKNGRCTTCHLGFLACPGHFGHVELPVPVYNPLVFGMLYRLVRQQCQFCFHFRMDREEVSRFITKIALLTNGRLTDAVAMQVSRSTLPKELAEVNTEDVGGRDEDCSHSAYKTRAAQTNTGKARLTSLGLEAIQDTISDLFARMPKGKCKNCDACSPNIKKMNTSRLFKVWSTVKSVAHNSRLNKQLPNLMNNPDADKSLDEVEDAMAEQMRTDKVKRSKAGRRPKRLQPVGKEDADIKSGLKKDEDEDDEDEDDDYDQELGIEVQELVGEQATAQRMAAAEEADEQRGNPPNAAMTPFTIDLKPKYMTPMEVEALLKKLWEKEWQLLALIFGPGGDMWGTQGAPGRATHAASVPGMVLRMSKMGAMDVEWSAAAEASAKQGWRMFFLRTLPVAPNRFRPPSVLGDQMFEHPQNASLQKVLTTCLELNSIRSTIATSRQLQGVVDPDQVKALELGRLIQQWLALQDSVAMLMDSTMAENPGDAQGIRQALEKKEGLFRKNMMGKRVNFAARSTISPDPYIGTGEIGIPPYFAMRLCFPERVTPWNVERLREAIMRGPKQLNGAVAVEDESGRVVVLAKLDDNKRAALGKQLLATSSSVAQARRGTGAVGKGSSFVAPNKIVYRHVQNGDLMLTNRQPTLHKPGLMGHRARVLHGEKTIRMHYANCATFNADFDGDEINLHLPQDQFGRAEGYGIVHADHQYIVPTDGKPIRGLIQDHVVSAVLLTNRDTWLTRAHYMQLIYIACSSWRCPGAPSEGPESIPMEPPAIMKPVPLWSGKQVVSTVVSFYTHGRPPLTFSSGSKVPAEYWGGKQSGESELIFHQGYMVSGCIDKNQFGKFGMVHAIQELYGGTVAGAILNCFSRLFTAHLQWHGFTCGFDDLLLTRQVEEQRKAVLERAEMIGLRASADFAGVNIPEEWVSQPALHVKQLTAVQAQVNTALSERYRSNRSTGAAHDMKGSGVMHPLSSEVVKTCLPAGQVKPFPKNCLSLMTISGAKGSLVNFSQISCLLGQQELEGRRVPRMASGATLPCFAPYDGGARSCGYVGDRFLTGLRPQEYYFHCMAGREGLIDTTVKTARSGYLQRCMVKNLETLRVHYDYTVRDNADGSIVQFFYGDDGLDVTQTSYMSALGFLAANAPVFAQAVDRDSAAAAGKVALLSDAEAAVKSALKKRAKLLPAARGGDVKAKAKLNKQLPLMATHPPSVLGATSEAFSDRVATYVAANPEGLLSTSSKKGSSKGKAGAMSGKDFTELMALKFMRAMAAPGEAVGVLAAQSIGEPSTQMTLNTFHMAGRGEANVTMGIPRLREILITAAPRIKLPVMILPLLPGMGPDDAATLAARMRRLRLAECLEGISLEERPVALLAGGDKEFGRVYAVTLKFFSPSQYPPEIKLTFKELVTVFKESFCSKLKFEVEREVKRKSGASGAATLRIGRVAVARLGGEEAAGGAAPGDNDDGEGEAGPGGPKKSKDKQALDDAEDGQDEAADDLDEEAEQDETMAEGKSRFQSANDETTYEAEDEDDQAAAKDATRMAERRSLAVMPEEQEEDEDEVSDDETQPATTLKTSAKKGAKTKAVAKPKTPKSAKAEPKVYCTVDSSEDGIDFKTYECRLGITLPLRAPKLLMLEVVERVAAGVMVRETPGIDKVYVLAGEGGKPPRVQTDGMNFEDIVAHSDLLDANGITTNDVAAMLRTYGVEAARATILYEVQSVFAAYGIGVDNRHLGLIADFMTHQGGYRACNRMGIESSVSPFLKMSFETAAHFLTDATLKHSSDDLKTPSARLCVGSVVEIGTGAMGLVHQLGGEAL